MRIGRTLQLIGCILCLAAPVLVATPVSEWSQTFDAAEMELLCDVLPLGDDGYALVGTVYDESGTSQLRVIRLNALGVIRWTYTSTEKQDVVATSAIVSEDGGIVVAADRSQPQTAVTSVFIQRITSDGAWEWSKEYGEGDGWNLQNTLLLEQYFGALFVFNTEVGDGGNGLHAIVLQDGGVTIGNIDCPYMGEAIATDIAVANDRGYLLSAGSFDGGEQNSGWLIRLEDADHCGWMRQIEGDGAGAARAVVQSADDSIYVCGSAVPSATYSSDVYIAKFSAEGTQLWYRIYGGDKLDSPADMVATPGGGVVIVGTTLSSGGRAGVLIFEIASGGEVLWSQTIGGLYDAGVSIHPSPDGGYIIGVNCGPEEMSACSGVRIFKLSHD